MRKSSASQLRNLAIQAKKQMARAKHKEAIEKLPESPVMLSLSELHNKTNLPYQLLRKMIVDEKQVPFVKVGKKYLVNYNMFLQLLCGNGKEVKNGK